MSDEFREYAIVRKKVITWFDQYGRNFPWRKTTDPYLILIAEILLRRTTASAVSRVFTDFINQFDSPERLASSRSQYVTTA